MNKTEVTYSPSTCQAFTLISVHFIRGLITREKKGIPRTALSLATKIQSGEWFRPGAKLSRRLKTLHDPNHLIVKRRGHLVSLCQVMPDINPNWFVKPSNEEMQFAEKWCTDLEIFIWLQTLVLLRGHQKVRAKLSHSFLARKWRCRRADVNRGFQNLVDLGLLKRSARGPYDLYTYECGEITQESSHIAYSQEVPKTTDYVQAKPPKTTDSAPPRIEGSRGIEELGTSSSYTLLRKAKSVSEVSFMIDIEKPDTTSLAYLEGCPAQPGPGTKAQILEALTREVVRLWRDDGGFIVILTPKDREDLKKLFALWMLDYGLSGHVLKQTAKYYLATIKDPNCTLVYRPLLKEFFDYRRDWVKRFVNGPQKPRVNNTQVTSDFDQESLEIARRLLNGSGS